MLRTHSIYLVAAVFVLLPVVTFAAVDGTNSDVPYSNASLNSVWIIATPIEIQEEGGVYIIFDGKGIITEYGVFNMPPPAGTYSVESNGSFTGTIQGAHDEFSFQGQILNDSTATIGNSQVSVPMLKVMDLSKCSGNWSGTFVQDASGITYNVLMYIDIFGNIQSCTGFGESVTGKFFCESNHLVGHIYTGIDGGWNEIMIFEGFSSLLGNTMTGKFGIEGTDFTEGVFSMQRSPIYVDEADTPQRFILRGNYPNPFNPSTTIKYSIPQDSHVILAIYNISGQLIQVLKDEIQTVGKYSITWNASGMPSGLYFCTLNANGITETRKMVVVR